MSNLSAAPAEWAGRAYGASDESRHSLARCSFSEPTYNEVRGSSQLSTQGKTTNRGSINVLTFATFMIALLALLLFIWLGRAVLADSTQDFDHRIRMAVYQRSSQPITYLMKGVTELGATQFLLPATACVVIILLRFEQPVSALLFVILMEGAVLLDITAKHTVRRVRPIPFFGLDSARSYSFPSGHALFSLCFFTAVGVFITIHVRSRRSAALTWTIVVLLIGLIGLSRIYLGIHYPVDVLGGYAAGLAWTGFIMGIHRTLQQNSSLMD
ncbi:MAG TPA: phosphatase PAP2 family protein [Acidobacteriota bacterium]|jgi:undecaprenyl-diphosphatase|nr:phosphatase PAP2 family protein [Acidobacteriota bacterium]